MKRFGPALIAVMVALAEPVFGAEAPQGLILHPQPKPVPEIQFQDGEGNDLTLANFHGKVVLLNIWATWCGPCREEMPTLDRLQAKLGGPDFEVLALSIDRDGITAITKFFGEVDVKHLTMYLDGSARAGPVLGAMGLPTSLLIDRDGQEIGRLVGPAEWDSPEMVDFIRSYLAKRSSQREPPHSLWDDGAATLYATEKGPD
jgi:thiol-disulfide isomerase/thioredoxin